MRTLRLPEASTYPTVMGVPGVDGMGELADIGVGQPLRVRSKITSVSSRRHRLALPNESGSGASRRGLE